MKRHLSVFELAARGAVYKTLIVSLIAAAAIFALLYALPGGALNLTDLLSGSYFSAEAENYVVTGGRYASYVFPAGLAVLYVLLSRSGAPKRGVNPDYTWRRLRITERRASLIQSGVHALCFALYMAIVLAACAAFAALFLSRSGPYDNDGQTLFFAAYTTMPLHAVLPLGEPIRVAGLCRDLPGRRRRHHGHGLLAQAGQDLRPRRHAAHNDSSDAAGLVRELGVSHHVGAAHGVACSHRAGELVQGHGRRRTRGGAGRGHGRAEGRQS